MRSSSATVLVKQPFHCSQAVPSGADINFMVEEKGACCYHNQTELARQIISPTVFVKYSNNCMIEFPCEVSCYESAPPYKIHYHHGIQQQESGNYSKTVSLHMLGHLHLAISYFWHPLRGGALHLIVFLENNIFIWLFDREKTRDTTLNDPLFHEFFYCSTQMESNHPLLRIIQ